MDEEPPWLTAIPDESDRAAVRAVLARKRWRESIKPLFPGPLYRRCEDDDCPYAYAYRVPPADHYHYIGDSSP